MRFVAMVVAGVVALPGVLACGQPATGNPYMEYYDRREQRVRVTVELEAGRGRVRLGTSKNAGREDGRISFDAARVYFPAPKRTGHALAHERGLDFTVEIDGRKGSLETAFVGDIEESTEVLAGGGRFGVSELEGVGGAGLMRFQYALNYSCFATRFDESAARRLPWPESWPPEAEASLRDEALITSAEDGDGQREVVRKYVKSVVGDNDVRQLSPLVASKYLTSELLAGFQLQAGRVRDADADGAGVVNANSTPVSLVTDFLVQPAGETLGRKRGTAFDLVTAWVAVMREIGIPARPVLAFDPGADFSFQPDFWSFGDRDPGVVIWGEFALYDAERDILTWVPVDLKFLVMQTTGKRDWGQPWEFFGSHPLLGVMAPIAVNWVPPFGAESYGVGLWGWVVEPESPGGVLQLIRFEGFSAARGGGDVGRGPGLRPAAGLASLKAEQQR